jgi:hypothetical protein
MRTPKIVKYTILFCLVNLLTGCKNALYFYETEKISLTAEARPDSSQPVQGSLGIKQRVVLIAPRKNDNDDAVSAISSFNFKIIPKAGTIFNPVLIQTAFITGEAADKLGPVPATLAAQAITLNGVEIPPIDKLAGQIVDEIKSQADQNTLREISKSDFDTLTDQNYEDILRITSLDRKLYTRGLHEALRKKLIN